MISMGLADSGEPNWAFGSWKARTPYKVMRTGHQSTLVMGEVTASLTRGFGEDAEYPMGKN
ncbi:MAG: hypothetical protein ACFCD0_28310 [Gemmataceae bacterium]